MAFIPSILEEHADEAVSLWMLRERVIRGVSATLSELLALDYRLDANLDGLRLAGDAGWRLCEQLCKEEPVAGTFAATVVALNSGISSRLWRLLEDIPVDAGTAKALAAALVWVPYGQAKPALDSLISSSKPLLRNAGVLASARHGVDPAHLLPDAIQAACPEHKAELLQAAGELGRRDLLGLLHPELSCREPPCRFWAAWSAVLLGAETAFATLEEFAHREGFYQESAVATLFRFGGDLYTPEHLAAGLHLPSRLAVVAAASTGSPAAVPLLLERMSDPETARFAGEAFATITGMSIAAQSTKAGRPPSFESGPTDDPGDTAVEPDPDDGLPWPDKESVHCWWREHQDEVQPGKRYLLGKQVSREWMYEVLRKGRQAQRKAAGLELVRMTLGSLLFNVQAPAFRQLQKLDRAGVDFL